MTDFQSLEDVLSSPAFGGEVLDVSVDWGDWSNGGSGGSGESNGG